MADICMIGSGYVGLVTGACFSKLGNKVICADVDESKINKLKQGKIPIFEDGLAEIIKESVDKNLISFTIDLNEAIRQSEIVFICVGTPETEDGHADLSYVLEACKLIGQNLNGYKVVVIKSTVPVTAIESIKKAIGTESQGSYDLVANPEFLAQGTAVKDFLDPDRVVIGVETKKAAEKIKRLYTDFNCPVIVTNVAGAILIKYAANAFLATKVSFINAMSNICEKVDANINDVAFGIGLDKRIGERFLKAGIGYGGSCFPKDTKALYKTAQEVGYDFNLLREVIEINEKQRKLVIDKLSRHLGSLKDKKITLFGLTFKPDTDDLREAPSIYIINSLIENQALVSAYDPLIKEIEGFDGKVNFFTNPYEAVKESDSLVLVTEYSEFSDLDYEKIKRLMKNGLIIDGRNFLKGPYLESLGFVYEGIGV